MRDHFQEDAMHHIKGKVNKQNVKFKWNLHIVYSSEGVFHISLARGDIGFREMEEEVVIIGLGLNMCEILLFRKVCMGCTILY